MDKAEEWAIEQWGGAGLGDERRMQRAVLLGTALAANQECAFRPAQSRTERARRENKESEVWSRTLTGIGEAPTNAQWVSVGDRGSDIFVYWRQVRESGWHCLLRVFVDRRIAPCGPEDHLLAHARQLPPMAQGELTLRARPGQAARVASLQIAWSTIRVRAPRNDPGSAKAPALDASVIRVWEQEDGALEWVLLATWPVRSAEDAWQCVGQYRLRWTIEQYHKCLKTGCRIESAQLKSADGLKALLGFQGVIAARFLQMSKNADDAPAALAADSFMPEAVEVMAKRTGLPCHEMTVARFRLEVPKLDGFIGRKSDGKPGWQTLWRGWQELMLMTTGYMLGKCG